jgi:hypothetical protein
MFAVLLGSQAVVTLVWAVRLFKAGRRDIARGDRARGILLSALATLSFALSGFFAIQVFRHLPSGM